MKKNKMDNTHIKKELKRIVSEIEGDRHTIENLNELIEKIECNGEHSSVSNIIKCEDCSKALDEM